VFNVKTEMSQGLHRNHLTICKFGKETESDFGKVSARFQAIATDIKLKAEAISTTIPATEIAAMGPAESEEAEESRDEGLQRRLDALRIPNQSEQ
jgi:hypothetical protein